MKLLDIKVMRGPNYWSNYRKQLIVLKLDLEELEKLPTNKIDGFLERLKELIPSLQTHRCSEGHAGGFFKRVEEGTWMGHVIEHIALEIQSLAGMECGYGRTRSTITNGVYNVVYSYEIEKAGIVAGKAAIRIAEALINGKPYDLKTDLDELCQLKAKYGFGPSTGAIVEEAKKLGIPYKRLNEGSFVVFGQGKNQRRIRATMTDSTSGMGIDIAGDKDDTKKILEKAYIPVPKGILVKREEELKDALEEVQFPLVIKPIDGNHGRGITTNITTAKEAIAAYLIAKEISNEIIVEEFIQGFDYRFLVVNYKLVAVAKRTPAMVMGDGVLTVQQLIDQTNSDPNRGEGHENILTAIKVDEITLNLLSKKNVTLNSVLPIGEILFLKDTANLSSGGTSRDVTDLVHPYNVFLAERAARILNLDICGIDVVAKDINVPLTREIGGIVEVNACPGLRMHLNPSKGIARNVAESIINMMFPEPEKSHVPLVAITGTNGKTTTTRLIAHMAKHVGHRVGYTTTDGIYIDGYEIHHGDCTGPVSAEAVLLDPTVDFAVLECARGGILRSGLGFDECDISIVTNITEDHLGLKDIHTLEEMAKVKSVVARSAKKSGFAILNADDDLVYEMRKEVDATVVLFSMEENNPRVEKHCENGGTAAFIEKGYVVVSKGKWKTRIEKVIQIPLSLNGRAECMIKNILPAVLAATLSNISVENIREALKTFIPSAEQTPGRMNIFKFKNFEVMVDYAHNTDGFVQLKKFMDKTQAAVKVGIVTVAGDRRDEDILTMGRLSAQMFDEIIIRHDHDMRGRTQENMTKLLTQGIYEVSKFIPIKVISEELDALAYCVENAKPHSFIVDCTDAVKESTAFLAKKLEEEQNANNESNKIISLVVTHSNFGIASKQ
ncbi:MAG TPA: cyanophycin synthetase [Bacteroidia bacterium]|nr:cyanophycin synthetase [Bacteroidia bacterium]HRG51272.1 cyanophycin synthetase [Bacteroidia bacterium]